MLRLRPRPASVAAISISSAIVAWRTGGCWNSAWTPGYSLGRYPKRRRQTAGNADPGLRRGQHDRGQRRARSAFPAAPLTVAGVPTGNCDQLRQEARPLSIRVSPLLPNRAPEEFLGCLSRGARARPHETGSAFRSRAFWHGMWQPVLCWAFDRSESGYEPTGENACGSGASHAMLRHFLVASKKPTKWSEFVVGVRLGDCI